MPYHLECQLRNSIVAFLFAAFSIGPTGGTDHSQVGEATKMPADSDQFLIIPGSRVGDLSLGDAEVKISQNFPKPSYSVSASLPGCGTEYFIGILTDASHPGALNVFAKDGRVVEIEAIAARYHTSRGVGFRSSPEDVRQHYPQLKSYQFLRGTPEALYGGPLIAWTDDKKGIAFTFAHRSRTSAEFSVYSIIVFKPGASFCTEDSVVPDPESWRELAPYSLGSPDAKADEMLPKNPRRGAYDLSGRERSPFSGGWPGAAR